MNRPKLLDLFCGAGGAAFGYELAGFEVVGVDIAPQPNYPYEFHQGDALKYLLEHWREFDHYHASPPCQAFTNAQKIRGNSHPDYIRATRNAFDLIRRASPRRHTVIENVPGAPLGHPVTLCGTDFHLSVYRHRLFECSFDLGRPGPHAEHVAPLAKMGRQPKPGEFMHVVGHFSGVDAARKAMDIDWMTRDELAESIPPAFTEWIGRQLRAALEAAA